MLLHDIIYLRWLFHGNDFYFAGTTFISWERFLILGHELKIILSICPMAATVFTVNLNRKIS